ncbi:hypothetical protein JNM87_00230 [Candidatus Saccharibacteria bacterium]|nr:hypothetical protein [Candidatus Saccharibacteria bacterium]
MQPQNSFEQLDTAQPIPRAEGVKVANDQQAAQLPSDIQPRIATLPAYILKVIRSRALASTVLSCVFVLMSKNSYVAYHGDNPLSWFSHETYGLPLLIFVLACTAVCVFSTVMNLYGSFGVKK